MADKYILDGKNPVAASVDQWTSWFDGADRNVAKDSVSGSAISTVFLGLNHQFGNGPPLIFETMIFGGKHNEKCWRCSTWDQAEKQHANAVVLASQ